MKTKLIIIVLLLLCFNVSNTFAKPKSNNNSSTGTIKGIISDSNSNELLEFATAILQNSTNDNVEQSVITNPKGEFTLNTVKHGNYNLKISFVGYNDYETTVQLSADTAAVNLGAIKLQPVSTKLGAATVVSRAPLIERKMDMLVMNIDKAVSTAGENALDILKKAPGVSIDKDGNIKLLGGSVLVQIDGRETRLSGAELADLLKTLDGSELSKIEIINSPSAKQDASGGSGILNIRTKKSSLVGFNGSINAGTGTIFNDLYGYNGGVSLNLRREKYGVYGSFNHNKNVWGADLIQERKVNINNNPSFFRSDANIEEINHNNNYRGGLDIFINKKNTLGFLVTGNFRTGSGITAGTSQNSINDIIQNESYADYKNENENNGVNFNTNYKTIFGEGHDLSIDLDYAKYNYDVNQDQSDFFRSFIGANDSSATHNIKTPRDIEVYSAKTDYKRSFGEKFKLETGAKISNSETNNSSYWQTLTNGNWEVDNNRTNDFEYTERVAAAYASLGYQVSEKISLKGGLRWENTHSKSYSPTTKDEITKTYNDFFPTFFAQYKHNEKNEFTLSYNKRINRPGYWALNPFRTYTDAYSYISGNPHVTPEYSQNLNLSHSLNNKLITTLMYRHSKDLITQAPYQEEGSLESGFVQSNFGYTNMVGASIAVPNLSITKWWAININVWAGWLQSHSMKDGNVFDDYSVSGNLNLTNNFTFAKTWKIEQGAYIGSPSTWGYMKSKMQNWTYIGVKKSLLDNKLDLSLNIDDPLKISRFKANIKYGHVDNYYDQKNYGPRIRLHATWRFGSTKINNPSDRRGGNADELNRIN